MSSADVMALREDLKECENHLDDYFEPLKDCREVTIHKDFVAASQVLQDCRVLIFNFRSTMGLCYCKCFHLTEAGPMLRVVIIL